MRLVRWLAKNLGRRILLRLRRVRTLSSAASILPHVKRFQGHAPGATARTRYDTRGGGRKFRFAENLNGCVAWCESPIGRLAFPGTATARGFRPRRDARIACHGRYQDVRLARLGFGVKLTGCGAATTLKLGWLCSGAGRRVRCWLVAGGRS